MTAPRRIFLTGFMGSGKTSIGRRLAELLDYPFVDIDEIIENSSGTGVREIFENEGEAGFRAREAGALLACLSMDRAVIATGGGTFVAEANRDRIQAAGVSVFLDVPFGVLVSRLAGKAGSRPLFRDPVQAFQLYSSRLEFYKMADITLSIRAEETVEEISRRAHLALPFRNRD